MKIDLMTAGQLEVFRFVLVVMNYTEPFPRVFFSVVQAGTGGKPRILGITHRLTRQETNDNHTVAF